MDVKHKIGPLPAYAWALILGGSIGVYLLVKHGKGTTGTTGQAIPELTGQALPSEAGGGGASGGAAGSLEALEAKDSAEIEALRQQVSQPGTGTGTGLGAGIGEVIEAREALEALGLSVGNPQHNVEASSAANSAVKKATGKGAAAPISSARGKYRPGTFKGHAAHIYTSRVHGGVGPRGNVIVLGGPAKAGHAQRGSHAPAHVSKPPAHHTAAKPTSRPASHVPPHAAPHAAPHHEPPKQAPRRYAPKPAARKRRY